MIRAYSCPSPTDEGGDDLENMAASSSLQAWFDTDALEVRENDNLDVVATTEQHSKTALRLDVQIEPPEEGLRQLRIHHGSCFFFF